MRIISWNFDSPVTSTGARNRHIIQTFADAVNNFVPALVGLDEIRLVGNPLEQRLGVPAQSEEIILLRLAHERLAVEGRFELVFLGLVFR